MPIRLVFAAVAAAMSAGAAMAQMAIPGVADVSPTGAGIYSIPIALPPGTAGMAPALTLEYNSQSGNGLLGKGWALGGIPAIGRCPKFWAKDATINFVKFDDGTNDQFCLDGQRLVPISGANGANGTEYRTEIDGFSRINSFTTGTMGPDSFTVWTKSGHIMEFAKKYLIGGTQIPRLWSLSKVSDTAGNYYTIGYLADDPSTGETMPTIIEYTGNSRAGTFPYNTILIAHEPRPDVITTYQAGRKFTTSQRITTIAGCAGECIVNRSNIVFSYTVSYFAGASGTVPSRVAQITKCTADGSCLPVTGFTWQGQASLPGTALAQTSWAASSVLVAGDFNGDGRTDTLLQGTTTKLFTSDANGNPVNSGLAQAGWDPATYNITTGDWNGDGKTDIILAPKTSGNCLVFTSAGTSFTPVSFSGACGGAKVYVGDWDGNGQSDIVVVPATAGAAAIFYRWNGAGFQQMTGITANWGGSRLVLGDWNGDGRADIAVVPSTSGAAATFYTSTGSNFTPFGFTPAWGGFAVLTGDWNGDGITDVAAGPTTAGANITFYLGTGAGFVTMATQAWGGNNLAVGDWNGDGKSDIAVLSPTAGAASTFYLSNGAGFTSFFSSTSWGGCRAYTGDFNGDGATDPWCVDPATGTVKPFITTFTPLTVSVITDGLGVSTTMTPQRLSLGTFYTKQNNASFPTVDVGGAIYVVPRVSVSNGLGIGQSSRDYTYFGAKANAQGRGFLGFNEIIITDAQTGVQQVTTYRQDFPFTGLVASRAKIAPKPGGGTVLMNSTTNTYCVVSVPGGANPCTTTIFPMFARYFPYLTQTLDTSTDLDGTLGPAVRTTTHYDCDTLGLPGCFGNPTQVTVETGTNPISGFTSDGNSTVTVNTFANDTVNWFLGRLTRTTVTSTTP